MRRTVAAALLSCLCCLGQFVLAAEATKLTFDTYEGYFVSNKFEPKAAESYVVIHGQREFDEVFGAVFVMNDKSHRMPKDAFKSLTVIAPIKRGNVVVEYKVESVTEASGVVKLKYTATSTKSDTATFACPLISWFPTMAGRNHPPCSLAKPVQWGESKAFKWRLGDGTIHQSR